MKLDDEFPPLEMRLSFDGGSILGMVVSRSTFSILTGAARGPEYFSTTHTPDANSMRRCKSSRLPACWLAGLPAALHFARLLSLYLHTSLYERKSLGVFSGAFCFAYFSAVTRHRHGEYWILLF